MTWYLNICAVCNPLGQLLRGKANPLEVERISPLRLSLSREMHEGWSAVHVQLGRKVDNEEGDVSDIHDVSHTTDCIALIDHNIFFTECLCASPHISFLNSFEF